jgi:hypothetical protein
VEIGCIVYIVVVVDRCARTLGSVGRIHFTGSFHYSVLVDYFYSNSYKRKFITIFGGTLRIDISAN